jgi:hypothetical protein
LFLLVPVALSSDGSRVAAIGANSDDGNTGDEVLEELENNIHSATSSWLNWSARPLIGYNANTTGHRLTGEWEAYPYGEEE